LKDPIALVIHDGELADIVALLRELQVPMLERVGEPEARLREREFKVVIASAKRMRGYEPRLEGDRKPVQIAVLESESKTLRAMLQRRGVELLITRPVHPAALRLLILHAIYQGPEKRKAARVSIGAPVRYKAGLRRRPAILADLSVSGARLLSSKPLSRGRSLTLLLEAELTGGKALRIPARVLRSSPAQDHGDGTQTIALSFNGASRTLCTDIGKVVRAHSSGPATLPRAAAAAVPVTPSEHPVRDPLSGFRRSGAASERRGEVRRAFEGKISDLGEDAAKRVLLGRDVSSGGMRVDATEQVALGEDLTLALHVRARHEPVVVQARVSRDDGMDGLMLQFHQLSDESAAYLEKMVNFLPILAQREDGESAGVIVSEILKQSEA